MIKRVTPDVASQILRSLPDKAFLFAKKLGEYTGEYADSLTEFLDKMPSIPLECIEFHQYPRPPDFERWIRDALGDEYLATKIRRIDRSIKGEALRQTIQQVIENRVRELQLIAMTRVKGIGVKYSTKLIDAGIHFIEDLARSDSEKLAKMMGISERVTTRWIRNANQTLSS